MTCSSLVEPEEEEEEEQMRGERGGEEEEKEEENSLFSNPHSRHLFGVFRFFREDGDPAMAAKGALDKGWQGSHGGLKVG